MSYIDGYFDRNNDIIKIVERNSKGEREFKDIPVNIRYIIKTREGNINQFTEIPYQKSFVEIQKSIEKNFLYTAQIKHTKQILTQYLRVYQKTISIMTHLN